jgi:secreted trypsin-like serine protease
MLSLTVLLALPSAAIEPAREGPSNVVGGAAVAEGDWLDAAGIDYGSDILCSGVLVAPNVVLTAGHCTGGIRNVVLGATDYTDPDAEVIRVQRTYKYPSYWGNGDIAALKLETDSVHPPRPIALDCILDDYLANGSDVTIVGYGAHDIWGQEYDSTLREAFTTVTDFDCSADSSCWDPISPGGEIGAATSTHQRATTSSA